MITKIWMVIVLAAGLTVTALGMLGVWSVLRKSERGNPQEKVPLSSLQKWAWGSLGVGVVVTVAILVILSTSGLSKIQNTPVLRVTVEILPVAGLLAYLINMANGLLRPVQGRVAIDERDKAILERASYAQAPAVIVSIAAWMIILTEAYWQTGQVPVVYLALVFWSCLLVAMMALPVAVLVGYWRS